MREFPQDALATHALARGEMSAGLHRCPRGCRSQTCTAPRAPPTRRDRAATPRSSFASHCGNFERMRPRRRRSGGLEPAGRLARLDASRARRRSRRSCATGKAARRIRECHGDLHLGNIAAMDGRPRHLRLPRIQRGPALDRRDERRCVPGHGFAPPRPARPRAPVPDRLPRDHRRLRRLARAALLSRLSGDGARDGGLRARRSARTRQLPATALVAEFRGYLGVARDFARERRPAIVITHGFSGCGKTTSSQSLVEAIGGSPHPHRRRAQAHARAAPDGPPPRWPRRRRCTPAESRDGSTGAFLRSPRLRLRRALPRSSTAPSSGGGSATCSATSRRSSASPFVIVTFDASEATLRARIARRMQDAHGRLRCRSRGARAADPLARPARSRRDAEAVAIDAETPAPASPPGRAMGSSSANASIAGARRAASRRPDRHRRFPPRDGAPKAMSPYGISLLMLVAFAGFGYLAARKLAILAPPAARAALGSPGCRA